MTTERHEFTEDDVDAAVLAERERCQRVCRLMSFEFFAGSAESDVLQCVATRLDMPEYDPPKKKPSVEC